MAEETIRSEYDEWVNGDNFTAGAELKDLSGSTAQFTIGEDKSYTFELKIPVGYPKTKERFAVSSKDRTLDDWVQQVNEFCNGPSSAMPPFPLEEVLSECANSFAELVQQEEDDYDTHAAPIELEKPTTEKKPKGPKPGEFFIPPQGTGAATARLLSDLERVKEADWGRQFGFFAELCKDPESGLPDLYHWHVKLQGFDKDDSLYHELKKRGVDHILLELSFPFDYPNNPPFVRVVRPRFEFRTGHVTIGGSICMELLTSSGWMPTNDIETIIIQIRANMNHGGAKLDMSNHSDYTESEAFSAFDRVAGDHKWKIPDWHKYRRQY